MVMVLILIVAGSLTIVPLLDWMGTGLRAVRAQTRSTETLYAADAGVQEALWKISDNVVPEIYPLSLTYPAITVNSRSVVVNIDATWILDGIVDRAHMGPHTDWVAISGQADDTGLYVITLQYIGNPGQKKIQEIGVWLPLGFDYVAGSAALFPDNVSTSPPTITPGRGGMTIQWLGLSESWQDGNLKTQTFNFTPVGKVPRGDIAWVMTDSQDIGYSTDMYMYAYKITSTATDTATGKSRKIVAYITKEGGSPAIGAIVTWEVDPS